MPYIKGRLIEANAERIERQRRIRKPYAGPAILYELELETRAGSPLLMDPLNPLNLPGSESE